MIIRPATEADIPAIVGLLKLSLGESLMPKSESFWRWKHLENPFGQSEVLLAWEDEKLIGVRAFMRWDWRKGQQVFKALRAVDTATHPDHQGKGIFSALTRELVDRCKANGDDFIFNTPNIKSRPGYLKLGWTDVGRLPIKMAPRIPLRMLEQGMLDSLRIKSTDLGGVQPVVDDSKIQTPLSDAYLNWRYVNNPVVQYYILRNDDSNIGYGLIFRMKKLKVGYELRICEAIESVPGAKKAAVKHLEKFARQAGVALISTTATLPIIGLTQVPLGPRVTVNYLSGKGKPLTFQDWNPSLGDLEFF